MLVLLFRLNHPQMELNFISDTFSYSTVMICFTVAVVQIHWSSKIGSSSHVDHSSSKIWDAFCKFWSRNPSADTWGKAAPEDGHWNPRKRKDGSPSGIFLFSSFSDLPIISKNMKCCPISTRISEWANDTASRWCSFSPFTRKESSSFISIS